MVLLKGTKSSFAGGFIQLHRLNYDETFGPTVKPSTIRLTLTLAFSQG